MVEKVNAYLLPWSLWKCRWHHWFSMVSFLSQHVVYVVTTSSICLLRPSSMRCSVLINLARCSVLINLNSLRYRSQIVFCILHHSSFLSVAGKLSRMCETYKFKSSLRRSSSFDSCLSRGALDRVSAVTNSLPGTCCILNEYFISLIRNL